MENIENANLKDPINPELKKIPYSNTIFILGLLSVAGSWMLGIVGLSMGIITLILADNSKKMYLEAPDLYVYQSYKEIKAGVLYAKIGSILSGLFLFFIILKYILTIFSKS
jgi:hypothetical protein